MEEGDKVVSFESCEESQREGLVAGFRQVAAGPVVARALELMEIVAVGFPAQARSLLVVLPTQPKVLRSLADLGKE
jgi:hypothetical protein